MIILVLCTILHAANSLFTTTPIYTVSGSSGSMLGSSIKPYSANPPEILVGSPGTSQVYLYSLNATNAIPIGTYSGPAGSRFGRKVSTVVGSSMFTAAEADNSGILYQLQFGSSLTASPLSGESTLNEQGFSNSAQTGSSGLYLGVGAPGTKLVSSGNIYEGVYFMSVSSTGGATIQNEINSVDYPVYAFNYFGYSITIEGFFSNSGTTPDLAVGAPRRADQSISNDFAVGWAGLYAAAAANPQAFFWQAFGEQSGSYFGATLAAVDMNGDGFDDLFVAAPSYVANNMTSAGKVYLYLGDGSAPANTPVWTAVGLTEGEQFGYSISPIGDINADGYNDVAIGSPFYEHNTGAIYIYFGSATGVLTFAQMIVGPYNTGLCTGSEQYQYFNGSDYQGVINTTESGLTCEDWASAPAFTSLPNNYCRNPNNDITAWCYTTNSSVVKDYCNLPTRCANLETGFGYSAGSIDIDLDNFPDLVVGSLFSSGFTAYLSQPFCTLVTTLNVSPYPLQIEQPFSVQICVANQGPANAQNIPVNYYLPTAIIPIGFTANGTYTIGSLPSGTSNCTTISTAAFTVPLDTNSNISYPFFAVAQVSGRLANANPSKSSTSVSMPLAKSCASGTVCIVDLSLTVTAPSSINASQNLNVTVTINYLTGTDTAFDVVMTSTGLPTGVTFLQSNRLACLGTSGGFTCQFGNLNNTGFPLTTNFVFSTSQFTGTNFSQTIQVTTQSVDTNPSNSINTLNTTVIVGSNVTVVITAPIITVTIGQTAPYTITVQNAGTTASQCVLWVDWSSFLEIKSLSITTGTCRSTSLGIFFSWWSFFIVDSFSCSLGDLTNGEVVVLTLNTYAQSGKSDFSFVFAAFVTCAPPKHPQNNFWGHFSQKISCRNPRSITLKEISVPAPAWAIALGVIGAVLILTVVILFAWRQGFFKRHLPPNQNSQLDMVLSAVTGDAPPEDPDQIPLEDPALDPNQNKE